MTEQLGRISKRDDAGWTPYRNSAFAQRPVSPRAGRPAVRRSLPTIGMVLAYLGMVALLSTAPFWHQGTTAHEGQLMACTDFGGSR